MTKNDSTPTSIATVIINFIRKNSVKRRNLAVNKYVYIVDSILHKIAKIKILRIIEHISKHF